MKKQLGYEAPVCEAYEVAIEGGYGASQVPEGDYINDHGSVDMD